MRFLALKAWFRARMAKWSEYPITEITRDADLDDPKMRAKVDEIFKKLKEKLRKGEL